MAALRLWTGPMSARYNGALREATLRDPGTAALDVKANSYSTTIGLESSKYPTPYVSNPLLNPTSLGVPPPREASAGTRVFKSPTPLGAPPPRWGARRGPERSGGPRRDPRLKSPPPPGPTLLNPKLQTLNL